MGAKKLVEKPAPSKVFTRNTNIIFMNIMAACVLLFCCCFFLFQNLGMFYRDLISYMIVFPIVLLLGISFVCFYIIALVVRLEIKAIVHADKYDLLYKIIFSMTFIALVFRSWLGDFMWDGICSCLPDALCYCAPPQLSVAISMTILAMLSGLMTWFTPKIKDNDNTDF